MPTTKTPYRFGSARFTLYTDGCVRLEYDGNKTFHEGPSLLVGPKKAKAKRVEITTKGKLLTLTTPRLTLKFTDDGKCFHPGNLTIAHKNMQGDEQTWVPGKADRGNLASVSRSLDVWEWCGGPKRYEQEGLLSTDGAHFFFDEARAYWNDTYDWPESAQNRIAYDGYFFAYGDDYQTALKDFITVFGRIPMIPRWAFGFWYSRWYAYTDREFIALAKRYQRERMPIDVMIIDTDWRDGWGGYDWSKKYFPNPEKTLAELHEMGLHTSLNDHPGYDNYDHLPDSDSHLPALAERIGPLPHEGRWACDWSRKEAVEAWKSELLGPFFDQGMDFWWIDGWIKQAFKGLDSQLWANKVYFDLREEKTGDRGLVLSRWGGLGSHRYPVQFSGDTFSKWDTLKYQIEFTARSCGLGAVYWSHDIGGFHDKVISEEMFVRWVQFGAFSPVFRTHSAFGVREPWNISPKAKTLFRKYNRMRYALAPLFYTLAREAHDTGMPLTRPLYLHYPKDGGAMDKRHQYLLGRDLLVIPADDPIPEGADSLRKQAFWPPETWYELETGEIVYGNRDADIHLPLERIGLYVRSGAILPSQPVGNSLGTTTPSDIQLDWFPKSDATSSFELYEDDNHSQAYLNKACCRTRITGKATRTGWELTIAAPRGSYEGMPEQRRFTVQLCVPADQKHTAQVRVGKGVWKHVPCRTSTTCLAGELKTALSFKRVSAKTAGEKLQFRFIVTPSC